MTEIPFIIIVTGVELLLLATVAGAVLSDLWILPSDATMAPQALLTQMHNALWRVVIACVVLLAVVVAAELLLRTANMSELPLGQAYTEIDTVLFRTHYGFLWLVRAGSLLGLAVAPLVYWRNPASRIASGCALLILIIIVTSFSASGHAGDDGVLSTATIANSLHILGALLWGGGIIAFTFFLLPPLSRGRESTRTLLAVAGLRLSSLAGIGLGLTILPGIYNAWRLVGSWHGLWTSLYGQLLVAKIILIVGMIGLGAIHRYRYVPSLQVHAGRPRPTSLIPFSGFLGLVEGDTLITRFRRSLLLEALLLVAVLTMAATLSQQIPPAHAEHNHMSGQARTETGSRILSTLPVQYQTTDRTQKRIHNSRNSLSAIRHGGLVEQFHPMAHRQRGTGLHMQLATDIGRCNQRRTAGLQGLYLGIQELLGKFWLQNGIGAGRTAAQM